jgi:gliding motility-associated protein GldM
MKKIIAVISICIILLPACNNNQDIVQFKAINETLKNANQDINRDNQLICNVLKDKVQDMITRRKASIWQPKAMEVKRISTEMIKYIDSLETEVQKRAGPSKDAAINSFNESDKNSVDNIFIRDKEAEQLYQKLLGFKKEITSVIDLKEFEENPLVQEDIKKTMKEFDTSLPVAKDILSVANASNREASNNYSNLFNSTPAIGAITLLNKIRYDILSSENQLLNYFNSMCSAIVESFDRFSAIIGTNSSYLKNGQRLELYAGLGAFSVSLKPQIFINGNSIQIGEDGVAKYTFKIKSHPGKFKIPVRIEFTKPDGSPMILEKKVEYIVAQ